MVIDWIYIVSNKSSRTKLYDHRKRNDDRYQGSKRMVMILGKKDKRKCRDDGSPKPDILPRGQDYESKISPLDIRNSRRFIHFGISEREGKYYHECSNAERRQ